MSVGRDPEQSTGWSNHIWKILHCHRSGDDWGSTIGNFERKRCATREWKNRVLGQTSRGRLVRQEGRAGWIHEWRHEGKIDAERARERAGRSEWYTRERQHANAIYAKTETHVRPEPRYRYNWTIPNLHLSSSFLLSLFTPLQTLLSTRYVALSLLSLSLSLSLPSLLFSFHLIARRSFFSLPFTVPRFLSFSIVTLISVILVVLLFAGSFVRSFILSSVPLVSSFAFSLRSAKSTSFPTLVSTIHPQVNIEDSFFGRKVVGITDYPTANTISIGDVWSKRGRLFWAHWLS